MSLFDHITKPIFSKAKSRACPNCGNRLDDFHVNLVTFSIECINCHYEFDPKKVFHDTDILLLSQYVPSDKHDQFLLTHGFVKETSNRTSKWIVTGLIVIIALCGVILGAISLYNVWWKAIIYLLAAATLILLILFYYQREKRPKWKSIKGKLNYIPDGEDNKL